MRLEKIKETEKAVLKVYQEVNPSRIAIEDNEIFRKQKIFRETLFRDRLKFPLEMFREAKLLDFGSGTGENCSFYARWGAEVTCVEMNELAVKRLKKLFSGLRLDGRLAQVHTCSLFDFKTKPQKFDIVTCDGVLNHVEDPRLGFQKLTSNLKSGGYIIISIGNSVGAFQRNLQKYALFRLSGNKKEKIVKLAKALFGEHVERASRFGRRTQKAVIYDTFVNPKTDNVSISEIMGWFCENKIRFYSSWPPLQLPFPLVDSAMRQVIDFTNKEYRDIFTFSELFWMIANKDDAEVIARNKTDISLCAKMNKIADAVSDVTPEFAQQFRINSFIESLNRCDMLKPLDSIYKNELGNFSIFKYEVLDFLEALRANAGTTVLRDRINKYKILFKGYGGFVDSWYVGYRE